MIGNVAEWCEDDWHGNYTGAPGDGSAWVDSHGYVYRSIRGGWYGEDVYESRSASRWISTLRSHT